VVEMRADGREVDFPGEAAGGFPDVLEDDLALPLVTGNDMGNGTGNGTGNDMGNDMGNVTGNVTGNGMGNDMGNGMESSRECLEGWETGEVEAFREVEETGVLVEEVGRVGDGGDVNDDGFRDEGGRRDS
jgi:hypothetical protein